MLNQSVSTLSKLLDNHLQHVFSIPEQKTILSYLVRNDGVRPEESINKMVFNIFNPQFEYTVSAISFQLLISANFNDYEEALAYLSQSMDFFRNRNVFTPGNVPKLPEKIEKMVVELVEETDIKYIKDLWDLMGCHYLPSTVYNVRVLSSEVIQTDRIFALNY